MLTKQMTKFMDSKPSSGPPNESFRRNRHTNFSGGSQPNFSQDNHSQTRRQWPRNDSNKFRTHCNSNNGSGGACNANYGNYGQNDYTKGGNWRINFGMINRDLRTHGYSGSGGEHHLMIMEVLPCHQTHYLEVNVTIAVWEGTVPLNAGGRSKIGVVIGLATALGNNSIEKLLSTLPVEWQTKISGKVVRMSHVCRKIWGKTLIF